METFTFRTKGMGEALGIIARKIKDDEDRAKPPTIAQDQGRPPLAQLFGEMREAFEKNVHVDKKNVILDK